MELYAGAPREAMGIRSPGEKTMYEVQQLQNAAGRIFQEKVNAFEILMLEPLLNGMLECSVRNLDSVDLIRVIDDDIGVAEFLNITRDDIAASGRIRPIGARHFSAKAQLMQNVLGLFNTPAFQLIAPHVSGKNLAGMLDDLLGTEKYGIFRPNVAIFEQQETASLANQAQEDLEVMQRNAAEQAPSGMPTTDRFTTEGLV